MLTIEMVKSWEEHPVTIELNKRIQEQINKNNEEVMVGLLDKGQEALGNVIKISAENRILKDRLRFSEYVLNEIRQLKEEGKSE